MMMHYMNMMKNMELYMVSDGYFYDNSKSSEESIQAFQETSQRQEKAISDGFRILKYILFR